ncbi:hypothetical protein AN1V17_37110 [Vallitalea sediminicola]
MKRLMISIIVLIMIITLSSCNNRTKKSNNVIDNDVIGSEDEIIIPREEVSEHRPPLLDSRNFIDERLFIKFINESTLLSEDDNIIAGIIPHHDVASNYVASLYRTIANNKQPEVIILIGPNHPGTGPRFQIGNYDFNTRAGVIRSDSNILNSLANAPDINYAIKEVFEKEHSVGLHMNYIKQYFDKAKVVPITIGETRNDEGILDVAKAIIEEIKDKDFIVIASIDFSHYLTLEEANEKDEITRKIIEDSDVGRMISLSNDHIDSPSSYALLIEILNGLGIDYTCSINGHDNSANIIGDETIQETTSYFSVSYIM